jgi:undecaprenyl diphosphate synthase
MDGNGRWAKDRGLPRTAGHEAGESSLFDVVEGAIELGVGWVSAYAFSTENWKRSPDEVRFLMGFNRDVIRRRRDEMHELGVRVRWAGRRPKLWRSVIKELEEAEELTRSNDVCTLTMCVNYGGRAEIADAARLLAQDVAAGRVDPDKVDEKVLARYLDEPDMPDVDLFLRTSASSARRTSCSGSPPTPRWSSSTRCGPTSTAATCGTPSSCTPRATGGTAARCRTRSSRSPSRGGKALAPGQEDPLVDLDLPAGLTARPPRQDDLPAMLALIAAYEQRVLGEPLVDLEDLEADWQRPSFDPEENALLVHEGDRLVACAEVHKARRASGCVHPHDWGRGVGSALVDWCIRTAAAQGGETIGQTVPDGDVAAVALFRSRGWEPLWTSWVLELPPGNVVPERPLPTGYRLRALRPGQDEPAAYRVIEDAFSEWPDREPTSYEDWTATVVQRPGFAPWQLLLAEDPQDRVVGACHLVLSAGSGWVNQVAVARDHRGQGLAQALLAAAFGSAAERGATRSELSTDSRTGALALYERLGMQVRWAFTQWAGPVTPQ